MSYRESELCCDWCSTQIGHKEDAACKECYEKLEDQVADLEKELESLRNKLEESR